ncbi:hypothetical protein EG327_010600 [Venturia inaequalis]|uniref:Uncharacterized protein n=1 Tax=Venturia inaequalis TaxID=5025 RepID=A0A8H3VKJ5_VENIN|nr:hypothetical protein EG327_010600 [Venturia inaequalis]
MTSNSTISTPLPASISPESLISALHNHDLYFKLVDTDLISAKLTSGDPTKPGDVCVYAVTSKSHTSDYEITNKPDGIDTSASIKTPVGTLVVRLKWRVGEGKLTEDIEIEANYLMRKMAKGGTEKNAAESHKRFFEELAKA